MGLPGSGADVLETLAAFVGLALLILGLTGLILLVTRPKKDKKKPTKNRPCGRECDC